MVRIGLRHYRLLLRAIATHWYSFSFNVSFRKRGGAPGALEAVGMIALAPRLDEISRDFLFTPLAKQNATRLGIHLLRAIGMERFAAVGEEALGGVDGFGTHGAS